ncbi:DUF4192 domain-containing protein [Arthrobacter bambusae]|uniref:DUF4192 domain-containing protein n=1 Tax=Arthrobacter bambusae TaxID=1338426 RepID=UPI00278B4FEC|nr:DUF4192 domain-containing protein [Arthrobacter bambusae]MDQ0028885.1 hypothetical protein [Arthrobacter bambusae]MDQ0096321.1 hypothetical protein [Arthrobacter bambusae]
MTAADRVTISRPEDILGFIPHALGLWPKESLVAITLRGQTLGATLRVDLPPERSGRVLALYSRRIAEYLEADHEADGVLLAFFSEDGWDGSGLVAGKLPPLLEALEPVLAHRGLALRDAWFIGSDFWRSAFCADLECCPLPGRPVDQILDSRLNAEMVFRGSNVRESPRLLGPGDQPVRDPEFMKAEGAKLEDLLGRWRSRKAFEEMLDVWTQVLDSSHAEEFDGEAAAFLRASMRIPAWRDAVVVLAAAGKAVALGGAEAFGFFGQEDHGENALVIPPGLRSPSPVARNSPTAGLSPAAGPPSGGRKPAGGKGAGGGRKATRAAATDVNVLRYGDVLLGLYPENPDWNRLTSLDQVLAMLSRRGGGEARAATLTIRGWIQWCQGSGSFAHEFFTQADAEQRGYRLAELLAEVVRLGTVCGWARNKSSAWRKFGGAEA